MPRRLHLGLLTCPSREQGKGWQDPATPQRFLYQHAPMRFIVGRAPDPGAGDPAGDWKMTRLDEVTEPGRSVALAEAFKCRSWTYAALLVPTRSSGWSVGTWVAPHGGGNFAMLDGHSEFNRYDGPFNIPPNEFISLDPSGWSFGIVQNYLDPAGNDLLWSRPHMGLNPTW